ncbi:MAG: hypothetical protein LC108_02095 [Anaerolineales bacterium]|nr:hypothetical protein [Anaerolineales bacterium]
MKVSVAGMGEAVKAGAGVFSGLANYSVAGTGAGGVAAKLQASEAAMRSVRNVKVLHGG